MSIKKKAVATVLVLQVLLLSYPLAVGASCPTQMIQKQMACCQKVVTACSDSPQVVVIKSRCCCNIENRTSPLLPPMNVVQKVDETVTRSKQANVFIGTGFLQDQDLQHVVCARVRLFYHPKFPTEVKIYDLVSSYLI